MMKRKTLLVVAAAAAVAAIVVLTTGAVAGTPGRSDQPGDGVAAFVSCLASHGPRGLPARHPAVMEAAPFYVALSTKESRDQASGRAKAIYYAAGETSTAICSIVYAAIAAAANIPGGQLLLVAMIVFNVISTIVTTRNPTGDYGKALRALCS